MDPVNHVKFYIKGNYESKILVNLYFFLEAFTIQKE